MGVTELFLSNKHFKKLKFSVFLEAGYHVFMVTYHAIKITVASLATAGHLCHTFRAFSLTWPAAM